MKQAIYFMGFVWGVMALGAEHPKGVDRAKLEARAAKDDAAAQFELAYALYWADGMDRDLEASAKWAQRAAKAGNAKAQFLHAIQLLLAHGVKGDSKAAIELLIQAGPGIEKAALQGDAATVQFFDDVRVAIGSVEGLVSLLQRRVGDRLEPHQQAAASRSGCQVQQRYVLAQQRGRESVPRDTQRDECFEESFGVTAVGDQVEVEEDRPLGLLPPDVGHHVLDRFLPRPSSPGRGDDTERAVVDTASRGFEHVGCQVAAAGQDVATDRRETGEVEVV